MVLKILLNNILNILLIGIEDLWGSHNSVVMAMNIGIRNTLSESINCGSKTGSSETARFLCV